VTREPARLRVALAGDRDVAVRVLEFMIDQGVPPVALVVHEHGSHTGELIEKSGLDKGRILRGTAFKEPDGLRLLRSLDLDYFVSVHLHAIVSREVLELPRIAALNLHPALLPFNRGWHTPSWAILDRTPFGATLHVMEEDVDVGDIVHQRELPISPADTAHSLYKRVKELEVQVFREAWPWILSSRLPRRPQDLGAGTAHRRQDLFAPTVQEIDPGEAVEASQLLDRLRALTTDRLDEAAYLVVNGRRYRFQLRVVAEEDHGVRHRREEQYGRGGMAVEDGAPTLE
jgi:methionyl-tRNA formyltransferase